MLCLTKDQEKKVWVCRVENDIPDEDGTSTKTCGKEFSRGDTVMTGQTRTVN